MNQSGNFIGFLRTTAMKPVLVEINDISRIGFETERSEDDLKVVVFLPGSPDPGSGNPILIDSDHVKQLTVDFGTAVATVSSWGAARYLC
jgi:uncharacterized membrane protein